MPISTTVPTTRSFLEQSQDAVPSMSHENFMAPSTIYALVPMLTISQWAKDLSGCLLAPAGVAPPMPIDHSSNSLQFGSISKFVYRPLLDTDGLANFPDCLQKGSIGPKSVTGCTTGTDHSGPVLSDYLCLTLSFNGHCRIPSVSPISQGYDHHPRLREGHQSTW